MDLTLIGKARARRVLALTGMSARRTKRDQVGGFRFLPELGSDEMGALFDARRSHNDHNLFSA
jgi:hypothetical protein